MVQSDNKALKDRPRFLLRQDIAQAGFITEDEGVTVFGHPGSNAD
jgi:hypothetical protein